MPALGTHLCAAADPWPLIDEVGVITIQVAFRQRKGLIQSLTAVTWDWLQFCVAAAWGSSPLQGESLYLPESQGHRGLRDSG